MKGRKFKLMNIIKFVILFTFLLPSVFANKDFGQIVSGSDNDYVYDPDKDDGEYTEETDPFISVGEEKIPRLKKDEAPSPFIDGEPAPALTEKTNRDRQNILGESMPGDFENRENYLEYTKKGLMDSVKYKGKDRMNFTLMYDSYNYKNTANPTDAFNRVYRDSERKDVYGILAMSYDRYITNGRVSTLWGLGTGFGYNGGKGVFEGEDLGRDASYDESAQFSLYTIPAELRFAMDIGVSDWFTLGLAAGPSALFIIENRTDQEESKEKKERRVVGYGGFATGSFKLHLGEMMRDLGYKLYSRDMVNRFFLNIEGRYQYYTNFQSAGMVVDGASFGLGVTYDFY